MSLYFGIISQEKNAQDLALNLINKTKFNEFDEGCLLYQKDNLFFTKMQFSSVNFLNTSLQESYKNNIAVGYTKLSEYGKIPSSEAQEFLNDKYSIIFDGFILKNYKFYQISEEIRLEKDKLNTHISFIQSFMNFYSINEDNVIDLLEQLRLKIDGCFCIIINFLNSDKIYFCKNGMPLFFSYEENFVIISSENFDYKNIYYIQEDLSDSFSLKNDSNYQKPYMIKVFDHFDIPKKDIYPFLINKSLEQFIYGEDFNEFIFPIEKDLVFKKVFLIVEDTSFYKNLFNKYKYDMDLELISYDTLLKLDLNIESGIIIFMALNELDLHLLQKLSKFHNKIICLGANLLLQTEYFQKNILDEIKDLTFAPVINFNNNSESNLHFVFNIMIELIFNRFKIRDKNHINNKFLEYLKLAISYKENDNF